MTVLEETEVQLDRKDLLSRSPIYKPLNRLARIHEAKRTSGIHLSGVLRYMATESGLLKVLNDLDEEALPLRMALGLAWEEFAVTLYPEIHHQPGEIDEQGVLMTCDGHSEMTVGNRAAVEQSAVDVTTLCLEEFKFTWKKKKTGKELIEQEWYWMQQGRGYCWGYGSTLVRWHICFANGTYRGSGPVYMRYLVMFSDQEVLTTGKMILKNRAKAIEKGYSE